MAPCFSDGTGKVKECIPSSVLPPTVFLIGQRDRISIIYAYRDLYSKTVAESPFLCCTVNGLVPPDQAWG